METPSVGILLLTFNSAAQIKRNWQHFINVDEPAHMVIIDNASTDNTVALLKSAGVPVTVNPTNIGYTAAINQGLQMLMDKGVEWCVLINPDVTPPKNYPHEIVRDFTAHPKCGIVSCRQVNQLGAVTYTGGVIGKPKLIFWPTIHDGLGNGWGVLQQEAVCTTRFLHRTQDCKEIQQTSWATFAVCALRSEMVREVGMLDPMFWLYASDSEYSMRCSAAGWEIWYNPLTFVHEGSANVKQANAAIQLQAIADLKRFALMESDYHSCHNFTSDSP